MGDQVLDTKAKREPVMRQLVEKGEIAVEKGIHMVEYHQEGSPIEKLHTNSENSVHFERSGGFLKNILLNKNCFNHQIFGLR